MGQPVVHFEVVGKDGPALAREENMSADGIGIGGGVSQGPEGDPGHVTFYVEVPDVEEGLAQAERLGGKRLMARTR